MALLRVAGIPRQRTAPKDCSPNLAASLATNMENEWGLMQFQSLSVEKRFHLGRPNGGRVCCDGRERRAAAHDHHNPAAEAPRASPLFIAVGFQ